MLFLTGILPTSRSSRPRKTSQSLYQRWIPLGLHNRQLTPVAGQNFVLDEAAEQKINLLSNTVSHRLTTTFQVEQPLIDLDNGLAGVEVFIAYVTNRGLFSDRQRSEFVFPP